MQSLTRNPLADPGLLGINAGAAAAVVIAIGLLGLSGTTAYVWFAFLGAGVAAVAVYLIGAAGRGGATPVRLALAGTAISAALTAVIYGIVLTDPLLLQKYNLWSVGGLGGRGRTRARRRGPLHGHRRGRRAAARAAAQRAGHGRGQRAGARRARRRDADRRRGGHHAAVRRRDGGGRPDLLPRPRRAARRARDLRARTCAGCSPTPRCSARSLLLVADVLGRVLVAPQELQAGLMLAFVGAPLFIAIVRRRKIPAL